MTTSVRSVRSYLSTGVAAIGVSALVMTAVIPQQGFVEADRPAVALAAQAQPLPQPATVSVTAPLDLLDRQATFHIELFVDFVVTGAELFGRIPPIAGTLLRDIRNGAAVPTAVGQALLGFAEVEFDAGRELVGFAEDWADFQIQFLRDLVAGLPAAIEEGPLGQLVSAALDVAAQIVDGVVEFSNTVITAAQTVVGDVLGDEAAAPASTRAVAALPALPTSEPQRADDEAEESVEVTPISTAEPSDESDLKDRKGPEDALPTMAKQRATSTALADIHDTLTSAALSAPDEIGDTADAEPGVDHANDAESETDGSAAGGRGYSNSAQRRNNASPGG